MADRLHRQFGVADGIHIVHAWDVADLGTITPTEDDVGKVARVVREGSPEYVTGGIELYPPTPMASGAFQIWSDDPAALMAGLAQNRAITVDGTHVGVAHLPTVMGDSHRLPVTFYGAEATWADVLAQNSYHTITIEGLAVTAYRRPSQGYTSAVLLAPGFDLVTPKVNRDGYAVGEVIELYPFAAPGATPFTITAIAPDDNGGSTLKLEVICNEPGALYVTYPGENTLEDPRTGFTSYLWILRDGLQLGSKRWMILNQVADGSASWHQILTREDGAPEPAPPPEGFTEVEHRAVAPQWRHPIHTWEAFDEGALTELGATADDVGRVARVGDGSPFTWWVYCGTGYSGQVWRQLDLASGGGGTPTPLSSATPTQIKAYSEQTGEGDTVYTGVADAGSEAAAAHGDHAHAILTGPAVGLGLFDGNTEGDGPELARATHTHDLTAAVLAEVYTHPGTALAYGTSLFTPTYFRMSSATAVAITLATDAATDGANGRPYPTGWTVTWMQAGDGQLTVAGAPGVALFPGTVRSRAKGATITAIKTGANSWDVFGDLE